VRERHGLHEAVAKVREVRHGALRKLCVVDAAAAVLQALSPAADSGVVSGGLTMKSNMDRKADLVARAEVISNTLRKFHIRHRLVEVGLYEDGDTVCFAVYGRRKLDEIMTSLFEKWEETQLVTERTEDERELTVTFMPEGEPLPRRDREED
jgi:hypothetical protein